MIAPTPLPWDSPKVVTLNTVPMVLDMGYFLIILSGFEAPGTGSSLKEVFA
jgi:hypothetical protein